MTNDQKREPTPVDTIAEEWVDTQLELYPEFHVWLGRPGREGEYADYSPAGAEHAIAKVKEALARIEAAEPVDEIESRWSVGNVQSDGEILFRREIQGEILHSFSLADAPGSSVPAGLKPAKIPAGS